MQLAQHPPHVTKYARAQQLVATALDQEPQGLTCKQLVRVTGVTEMAVRRALEALEDTGMLVRFSAPHLACNPYMWRKRA
jgi:predicted ArsR family transcriptional regulator